MPKIDPLRGATGVKNWKVKNCKTYLKSFDVVVLGNIYVFQNRCLLIKKLSKNNTESLIRKSIKDLQIMYSILNIEYGSRDNIVANTCNVLLNFKDYVEKNII